MILVDTSAWVDFDQASGPATDLTLTEAIRTGGDVAVTEPVLMEVLAGARSDRQRVIGLRLHPPAATA